MALVRCPWSGVPGHRARLSDPMFTRPSRQVITSMFTRPSRQVITSMFTRPSRQVITSMFTRPSRQVIAPGHRAWPSRLAVGSDVHQATAPMFARPPRRCSPGHRTTRQAVGFVAPGTVIDAAFRPSDQALGPGCRIRAPWPEGPRARLGERFQWVSEISPRILAPGGRGGGSGLVSLK